MASFLTEFVFTGIIACMLLLLAGLQAIAKYRYKKKLKAETISNPAHHTGSHTTSWPTVTDLQNTIRADKERSFVQQPVSNKEMV